MTSTAEALSQGWQLHQSGDLTGAERVYRGVLEADPNDANAWCYLGMACHDQDRLEEAVAAYRRAIRIQPHFPVAFNNLGNTLRMQRKLAESIASFDHALRLQPDYVNAHKNKGTALVWEGHLDEALACYQRAMDLAPDDAETHKNVGVIFLLLGRFEEGWSEYEWRWKTDETSLPRYQQPLWDGSSLDGKTILLAAEQGLGDTVHFIRYAAALKQRYDCRVVAACPRSTLPLLASCPGIDTLIAQEETPPPCDVFAPLLNVPGILRDTPDTFPVQVPYLSADPALEQHWKQYLEPYGGYRIGIAWQGNPKHQADRMRSIPLAEFAALGKLKGIQLFSLQKGPGVEQLERLAGRVDIVPLGDRLDETSGAFMDTAAVLKNLDLLVTSDTSLAHVAGALGVPTWLALSHVPDWRWLLDREDSPWYPTIRLFRQPAVGDWPSVFQRMSEELLATTPGIQRREPEDYRVATSGTNRLIRARHGLLLYNRHDVFIGRSIDRYGEFSEGEVALLRQILGPGGVVVETNANIGMHTLVLSQLVGDRGAVYASEPQRVMFQILCANMALNGCSNVRCRCDALGAAAGWIHVPPLDYSVPANFGGLPLGGQRGERVPVTTVDDLQLPRCDLIKVDVEGRELQVLQGASETIARCRPILYVENDRLDRSAELIEFIQTLGYKLYWHLPPLYQPANYFGNPENVFPNIVSSNMLCIHAGVKSSISGLPPIEDPHSHWMQPREDS
jgi:FkbM family methyltransferase